MNRIFLSRRRCLPYPLQRTGRTLPGAASGRVSLGRVPLGQAPSLHPSAAGRPALFGGFSGTTEPVRLPASVHHRRASFGLPDAVCVSPLPQADAGSPGSRARCFRACTGSLTARGPVCASR